MSRINNRQLFLQHLAQTSNKPIGIEVANAKGIYIKDIQGKEYIDLISGFSVCNIGHSHPSVIAAIEKQIHDYMHVIVYGEFVQNPQVQYAHLLTQHLPSFLDCVYFTNSGAEATEGAMKLAKRVTGRSKIFSFKGGYHGSTQGALSVMGDEYFKNAFRPLLPDVYQFAYNQKDIFSHIDSTVAAVIVEVVQAESGIQPAELHWLQELNTACKKAGVLLIVDEIQSGFGRTGTLFAFESYGIEPDILLLGKALGAGLPLGAFVASHDIMHQFTDNPVLGHITTFGGNPVSCAAGMAGLQVLLESNWMASVREKELYLVTHLRHHAIQHRSHKGLWMALTFENDLMAKSIAAKCIENGLITDWFLFAENKIRIAPPLCINMDELKKVVQLIVKSIDEVI
jgi:acetylornithine/succinyldiaminopimelate/putrescine aminotransferase